jgi:hypothetical protein
MEAGSRLEVPPGKTPFRKGRQTGSDRVTNLEQSRKETTDWNIETLNPTWLEWSAGGFVACDTVKGMVPDHICIVSVGFTQGWQHRWQVGA